jgi:formimidoylglutamate deiminase
MTEPRRLVARSALLPEGWRQQVEVTIAPDGTIASAGPAPEGAAATVDLLLPAPVNLHSHSFQRGMAGLAQGRGPAGRDSFWTWREAMYRFQSRLRPDEVEAIAAMAFVEMLEAGFGSVVEFHYLHHGPEGEPYADPAEMSVRILAAAERTGIGLTLLPVLYRFGGADRRPLEGPQRRFGNDPESFARLFASAKQAVAQAPRDFRIGVAPHSLRAVAPEDLETAVALAPDGPIHIHLAEQQAEVEEILARYGARPVAWLLDHAPVDARWCAIHCTQATGNELRRLAASGAVAGLCPITEADLGDGIFDAPTFLEARGRIGVGSDSNLCISLSGELRLLEWSQRLRDRARAVLADADRSTGRRLFEEACAGGAQAAARPCGAIRPGLLADLVALDVDNEWLCGRTGDALLASWIFAAPDRGIVREVWSAGRHVVRDGRHVARDAVAAAFCRVMRQIGSGA